jgi:DNA-binding NtrC family response regulator
MSILLLVDDEPAIQHAFRRAFAGPEVKLITASSAAEAFKCITAQKPDVVVLDLNLPDLSGLETFRRLQKIDARIPVIFITGHGTTDTAIEAMKLGAFDYLVKPLELPQLRELLGRAFEVGRLMRVPAVVAEQEPTSESSDMLVGRCAAMQDVYKAIGRVASQEITVLILGESGTGKELVARAIYQHSRRPEAPFLAINCAAIPESLLESELFGHEKGAFTGADRKRIGKFEQCTGGTLFLDEIGDMSPLTQTKILRVLQEQRFERVGGNESIRTDVRVIAATNRDLEKLTAAGDFRSDLYYRLSVFTIRLPPLRERPGDLPLLVDHFVRRFSRELGKEVAQVTPEVLDAFARYAWPGNLRELQSVLKQAILRATGPVLMLDFLPPLPAVLAPSDEGLSAPFSDWDRFIDQRLAAGSENLHAQCLEAMERHLVTRVLRHCDGNQVRAAKTLGITRGTLRTKIRALGITIDRSIWSDDDQAG